MKQRTTFFVPTASNIDPAEVDADADSLYFSKADQTAIEKRYTFGLGELSFQKDLHLLHELHIRWSSPLSFETTSPKLSRSPPGLHILFTPRDVNQNVDICPSLVSLFSEELSCRNGLDSFSRQEVTSERFSSSSTYQLYSRLDNLEHFQRQVARQLCEDNAQCIQEAATLEGASILDIDFDAVSHALTLTAYWTNEGVSRFRHTHKTVKKTRPQDSVEVGILQAQKADEPEELKFGGALHVLAADEKPDTTLFSFPSRHHPLPAHDQMSFIAEFQQPTGLHPRLEIKLPRKNLYQPKDSCALHAYFTFPSSIFLDRYQLSDRLFLQSQNLVALRSLTGETDLEAPDWVVKKWGSAALLEIAHPPGNSSTLNDNVSDDQWTITIPTHLRYLRNGVQDYKDIAVPYPVLFWACEAEDGLKMSVNPFDRINLGYDGLFGPKTMFYHIPPAASQVPLFGEVQVPILDPGSAMVKNGWVTLGTAIAVLLGFAWVLGCLIRGVVFHKSVQKVQTPPAGKKSL